MAIRKILSNDELIETASSLTGVRCSDLSQMTGGLHHRVYNCRGNDGNHYIIKYYHTDEPASEAKLINEFNSSIFMWEHDIHQIPQPVNSDINVKIAIYRFVKGSKLKPEDIDEGKITEITDFLSKLHSISKIDDAAEIIPAGEAVFSLEQLFNDIDSKTTLLKEYNTSNPYGFELKDFIESKLLNGLDSLKNDAEMIYQSIDLSITDLIHYEWTTLNPSGLGFHNSILADDGTLMFLDFESFGRDDPVKVVSDFILNTESKLKKEIYFAFLRKIIPLYASDEPTFKERIESLFPIFALKSTLLLLNEFEPEHFEKRLKVLGDEKESEILRTQLEKAENLLNHSKEQKMNMNLWMKTI